MKFGGSAVKIGEIASPAAGYADFLARRACMIDHRHRKTTPRGLDRTDHARGTRAQNDDIGLGDG
jgi:hypothetical protein